MDLEIEEVRERGRIVSTAAIVAVGVNTDGRREVPGIYRPFGDGALLESPPAFADGSGEDVLAYMALLKDHWAQVASTNSLERVNKEIKRRADVDGFRNNHLDPMVWTCWYSRAKAVRAEKWTQDGEANW